MILHNINMITITRKKTKTYSKILLDIYHNLHFKVKLFFYLHLL